MHRPGSVSRAIVLGVLAGLAIPAGAAEAAPKPNLRVTSVTPAVTAVQAGGLLSAQARVRNTGRRRAKPTSTAFFLSKDRRRDARDRRIGRTAVKALTSRRRALARRRLTIPADHALGRFRLLACVDPRRKVRETSERDNCRAARRLVVVTGSAPGPLDPLRPPVPGPGPAPAPAPGSDPDDAPAPRAAVLRIEEVELDAAVNHDLVELRALRGGRVNGYEIGVEGSDLPLGWLPDTVVATGDLIVFHANPGAECIYDEKTSKTERPEETNPACFDGAWDAMGITTLLPRTHVVVTVKDAQGAYQDAVVFTDESPPGTDFPSDVQAVQDAEQWLPADCGGAACSESTVNDISADWRGAETPELTVQRKAGDDTDTKADWVVAAHTLGEPNG